MSDTPLTDAVAKRLVGSPFSKGDHPLVDHARRLERALVEANEALDVLQACTGSILAAHGGSIKNSLALDATFARKRSLLAIRTIAKLKEGE